MRNIVTVFLIVIITAAMTVPSLAETEAQKNVVVFVIDSTSSILEDDQKFLSQFETFSHGEAVSKLIGTEVCGIFNVDDLKGNIDENKYHGTLLYILNQIKGFKRGKRVVVNISLGSSLPARREYSIIRRLYREGVIMVAAAGNDGMEKCWYPAAYDEVISVGACEKSAIAGYSNNCKDIDIMAGGKYTETRTRTMFFEQSTEKLTLHGTSFSTPRVTNIVVKMLKQRPGLTKDEIVGILRRTSTELSYSKCKGGRVNGLKALAEISDKYRRLYRFKNWSLITIVALSTAMVGGFLGFVLLVFVLLPVLTFLFRLFFPEVWFFIKKKGMEKVMNKKEKSDRDIKFLVKCLIAQDENLEEIARKSLLNICEESVQNRWRVRSSLGYARRRAKVNEFIDEKTPIRHLLWEIDWIFRLSVSQNDLET